MGEPARGYRWRDAWPGNDLAVTHGAYSPAKIEPRAGELVAVQVAVAPWLKVVDMPSVWAWARTEAAIERVSDWLAARGGELDRAGDIRPAADLLARLEARAESQRSRLGFDPLSRARLGRDVAATEVDLARIWAEESDEEGR
jgi:hypothetical protein